MHVNSSTELLAELVTFNTSSSTTRTYHVLPRLIVQLAEKSRLAGFACVSVL